MPYPNCKYLKKRYLMELQVCSGSPSDRFDDKVPGNGY